MPNRAESTPSRDEMMKVLKDAGFSADTIRQMGLLVLFRNHLLSQNPGRAEQMRALLCDADSQDPVVAREDLKDLL